ncbi:hypothetical protein MTR67_038984 [Solanum verrucosum]|uniref:Uncharacterized protein n=1 Tax=Solanum verrucosum TaxID=315347 RepID=A0AAF0UHU4_SOLVR|nr:hypothetical protein MTR67_038984 [Solanum verrucosum]
MKFELAMSSRMRVRFGTNNGS